MAERDGSDLPDFLVADIDRIADVAGARVMADLHTLFGPPDKPRRPAEPGGDGGA